MGETSPTAEAANAEKPSQQGPGTAWKAQEKFPVRKGPNAPQLALKRQEGGSGPHNVGGH